MSDFNLSDGHWVWDDSVDFREVITSKQWREWVLAHGNRHIVKGELREFKAKSIGGGVVEIYKQPLGRDALQKETKG